jgi:toxin secretion/phage lysis holin
MIEKLFNWFSIAAGVIGGTIAYFLGGWDALLIALTTLVVLDYITGVVKAAYSKELSSEVGFKGLLKKIMIFIVVAASFVVQGVTGNILPLREVVIVFFIANEGISLLENAAVFIPIPEALKNALIQLRDKDAETEDESEGK